jgi:peptidoglycan/xylan/chitin deacetylase (PgdA/CDA1 family)
MSRKKTDILVNVLLLMLIVSVVVVGFYGSTTNAFSADDTDPLYKGDTSENNVSLMINVYWGTEYLVPMLDMLDKYDAKTTFFIGGTWAANNPELLKEILVRGHELGNHGYHHKDQDKLNYQQNLAEIETCHKLVYQLTGYDMKLFAPPSGAFSSNTLSAASALGYKTIMWSRDTIDWRDKSADTVFSRATKNTGGGELILMHPTQHTANALERILKHYTQNNFKVVPVSVNIGNN